MYNLSWIERPTNSQREISPAETALRETYLAAQKVAFSLVCASNQLCRVESPDVADCAALIRVAVHKPEKERANAIKAAQLVVLHRQVDYMSTLNYYLQNAEAWQTIRPTLVAQLEAVAIPNAEPLQRLNQEVHIDTDLGLNCQAVADLIEECDIAINEANKRHYSRPTQKHAEAGFQKAVDALTAEVTRQHWLMDARMACHSNHNTEILRDVPVDKVSSTDLPAEYGKCAALDAAREAFERAFTYEATTRCRDFNESTRGSFNDTQLAESLLAATDIAAMQRVEQQRDEKLRQYGRSWRAIRTLVDQCQALYATVAELLPEALAEANAIEDVKMRRRAQNLCLFAARRLKENLRFVRDCDRFVGSRNHNFGDISAAVNRSHAALVERIKSKELHRPSSRCREEPYMG